MRTDGGDTPLGLAVDYEPVGSLAGVMRLTRDGLAATTTIAAGELADGWMQFPVMGGIAVVANIDM